MITHFPSRFSLFLNSLAIGIDSVPSGYPPTHQQPPTGYPPQTQPQAQPQYPPTQQQSQQSQQYPPQTQPQAQYPPTQQYNEVQQEPIHVVIPSLWGNREAPRLFRLNQPFSFTICGENVKPEQVCFLPKFISFFFTHFSFSEVAIPNFLDQVYCERWYWSKITADN